MGRPRGNGRPGQSPGSGRAGRSWWRGRLGRWLFWTATLLAVTVALVSVRGDLGDLGQAHVSLIYLLVVLGASASGGRALGFTLACACFLLIDYFLQTPYDMLSVDKPLDWLVLLAFLVTATVATQLLGRANAEAAAARRRAEEIDRLAALSVQLAAEAEHAEALREADRLKDALLASVSHDLRTPLTTIKALAHDLAAAGDERAAVIEQQADRLNHMVADLLDLSRLNAGGVPMQTEINAAEDLVGAAIQQVAGALGERELRTSLALREPMPVGRFDFVHSLRILVNLIENALKYSPADAPIEVAMRGEGEWIAIAVADRGRGVPPAERERIFEPFYRPAGGSPDGARAGGAGLGLAIARRLAEAQAGTLTYEDRPEGGSVFTLRLPAARLQVREGDAAGEAAADEAAANEAAAAQTR
ncbi:MAG TPA: ATP-binding protein [Thermoanaerobaculia bacterium]|nr:ATP-binding protein [Thermoanaerobaculia bacterium]